MVWLSMAVLVATSAAALDTEPFGEPAAREDVVELRTEIERLRGRLERLESGQAASPRALHTFELPTRFEFAGESVPLGRWDVCGAARAGVPALARESCPGGPVAEAKRPLLPVHRARAGAGGLPEDLKYVAVIESALLPGAYSHASALGIWQFIASTAKRYGLAVTLGLGRAARIPSAPLPPRWRTSGSCASASPTGRWRSPPTTPARPASSQALRHQGVTSYYQVALADETERYVFRALAAKLILAEPGRYGFEVPHEQRYRAYDADVVAIELRDRVAVAELARQAGLVLPGAESPQSRARRRLDRQGALRDPRPEGPRPRPARDLRSHDPHERASALAPAGGPGCAARRTAPPELRRGRWTAHRGDAGSRDTRGAQRDRPPRSSPHAGASTTRGSPGTGARDARVARDRSPGSGERSSPAARYCRSGCRRGTRGRAGPAPPCTAPDESRSRRRGSNGEGAPARHGGGAELRS